MPEYWWIWTSAALFLIGLLYFWGPFWRSIHEARFLQVQRDFHVQRERLEAKFVQLARAQSKPAPLRWEDCEFADDVAYVRHRVTGDLSAFVAVSIAADEVSDLGLASGDAVTKLQLGTAVFQFRHNRWETNGRAILNLTPKQAIRYLQRDWKIVGHEYARHV